MYSFPHVIQEEFDKFQVVVIVYCFHLFDEVLPMFYFFLRW